MTHKTYCRQFQNGALSAVHGELKAGRLFRLHTNGSLGWCSLRVPFESRPSGNMLVRQSRSQKQGGAGFTLLELMLTVALSIILATLASSEMRRVVERSREHDAIAQVHDTLLNARYRARREMVNTSFSILRGTMVVENSVSGQEVIALDPRIYSVSISTRDQQLTFTSKGGLTTSSTVTVTEVLRSGRTQIFTILPAIGSIRGQ